APMEPRPHDGHTAGVGARPVAREPHDTPCEWPLARLVAHPGAEPETPLLARSHPVRGDRQRVVLLRLDHTRRGLRHAPHADRLAGLAGEYVEDDHVALVP